MSNLATAKAITFDIDWAPDFIVEGCLDLCVRLGIPASFYATHDSPLLADIAADPRFELGIHPNFLSNSTHGRNYREVIEHCLDFAPDAISMRTHSLYQDSRMFAHIAEHAPQIRTDASMYAPGQHSLRPFDLHFSGRSLRRLPFRWEDDIFAETPGSDWSTGPSTDPGLNIFAFHPVHIAINSGRLTLYERMRQSLKLQDWTKAFVAEHTNKGLGARTYLEDLVGSSDPAEFMTISQMAYQD